MKQAIFLIGLLLISSVSNASASKYFYGIKGVIVSVQSNENSIESYKVKITENFPEITDHDPLVVSGEVVDAMPLNAETFLVGSTVELRLTKRSLGNMTNGKVTIYKIFHITRQLNEK